MGSKIEEKLNIYFMKMDSIEDMAVLPSLRPFDEGIIGLLSELSRLIMHDEEARNYPVLQTFAFFIRKANLGMMKSGYDIEGRLGKGLSFHIAPSNVPINFAYSLVSGLLAGNPCVVRASSKDFDETRIICRLLSELYYNYSDDADMQRLFSYISVVSYAHDKEVTDYLSSLANIRVIWGGDSTIQEIRRSPIKPRCTEVCFADRYSMLLIDADYLLDQSKDDSELYMEQIARQFYNDTYLFDQNACGSPRLVYWLGSKESTDASRELFWNAISEYMKDKYEVQPVIAVDKLTLSYRCAIELDGCHIIPGQNNVVTRVELDDITSLPDGKALYDYSTAGGFYIEYCNESLNALTNIVDEKFQTMTYIGDDNLKEYIIENGFKGIDRVVPIGHSADFGLVWDGIDLIYTYSRKIV